MQGGRSDEEKIPDGSPRSKETQSDKMEFQDKKKKTDRSNGKCGGRERIELKLRININIKNS